MNTRKFSGDMADQVEKDRDQLIEIREVLSWASQKVWFCGERSYGWFVLVCPDDPKLFKAPTLYEALRTAWEKRDE